MQYLPHRGTAVLKILSRSCLGYLIFIEVVREKENIGSTVVERRDEMLIKPILNTPTASRVMVVLFLVQLEQCGLLHVLASFILTSLSFCAVYMVRYSFKAVWAYRRANKLVDLDYYIIFALFCYLLYFCCYFFVCAFLLGSCKKMLFFYCSVIVYQ